MCRRIGQRIDDLQLLDDRAGPSVRDEERQRILVLRANVNEMDVQAVDLGDEVRQGLQLLLALAPVVLVRPVARECLHRRELRALRLIVDGLLLGAARGERCAPAGPRGPPRGSRLVNGRIAVSSADLSVMTAMWSSSWGVWRRPVGSVRRNTGRGSEPERVARRADFEAKRYPPYTRHQMPPKKASLAGRPGLDSH